MAITVIINLLAALLLLGFMVSQQRRHATFTVRVFTGLGLGVLLGAALQAIYGAGSAPLALTSDYLDIVGTGYIKLLQMIVMPLIMVSIIGAILKLKGINSLGKISAPDHRYINADYAGSGGHRYPDGQAVRPDCRRPDRQRGPKRHAAPICKASWATPKRSRCPAC